MVFKATLDLFDRLIRLSFYALIFLLPVGIGFVSSFAAFAISIFWIKRACVIMSERPKGFAVLKTLLLPAPSFLNLPMLCFVGAALISVIFSQNHVLSLMGFFGKLLRGVFLYISFLEAFSTATHINAFLSVWIFSALITGVSGLSQYFFGFDFIRHLPLVSGRISSTLRQANDFGAYILAICPLILSLLMHWNTVAKEMSGYFKKLHVRSLVLACVIFLTYVVLVVCLGYTFSRAAWVGFFVAITGLAFFKKEALPFIFLIIVGFIWIFMPVMVLTRDVSFITDNVKHIALLSPGQTAPKDTTVFQYVYHHLGSGRWGFWNEAIHIIHDYPWWGSGINTYSQMGAKYKINWGGYPHNSYLQLTAELGVLGLGTFLWMIVAVYFSALRKIGQMPLGHLRAVIIGVLASLTAYLIQSFFDTTFYSVQLSVLMWLMMAVMVSIVRMNQLTKHVS